MTEENTLRKQLDRVKEVIEAIEGIQKDLASAPEDMVKEIFTAVSNKLGEIKGAIGSAKMQIQKDISTAKNRNQLEDEDVKELKSEIKKRKNDIQKAIEELKNNTDPSSNFNVESAIQALRKAKSYFQPDLELYSDDDERENKIKEIIEKKKQDELKSKIGQVARKWDQDLAATEDELRTASNVAPHLTANRTGMRLFFQIPVLDDHHMQWAVENAELDFGRSSPEHEDKISILNDMEKYPPDNTQTPAAVKKRILDFRNRLS